MTQISFQKQPTTNVLFSNKTIQREKRPGCQTRKQHSDLGRHLRPGYKAISRLPLGYQATSRLSAYLEQAPSWSLAQAAASRCSFCPIGGCRQALLCSGSAGTGEGMCGGTLGISRLQSPLAPAVRHAQAWGAPAKRLKQPPRPIISAIW